MKALTADFIRTALHRAVQPVGLFEATNSRICIKLANSDKQFWIVTQYVAGRHGCGWEQDGFWAHSNDIDLFAGSQGYTIDVVKQATGHMVEPIMEKLQGVFADADEVTVRIEFSPYPNRKVLATLVGDSQTQELTEAPETAARI